MKLIAKLIILFVYNGFVQEANSGIAGAQHETLLKVGYIFMLFNIYISYLFKINKR